MSKRNKHNKPKGPKSPPQNEPVVEEKPFSEEKPVCDLKPDSEPKPVSSVVSEVKPSTPEVKPESSVQQKQPALSEKGGEHKGDLEFDSVDSPVKPKRQRNRKNKQKDNQSTAADSKEDECVEVQENISVVEKDVKVEEIKSVEKSSDTEVKSETSDIKEGDFKKSGRNKKKDKKDAQQSAPEKPSIDSATIDLEIKPEIPPAVTEEKSKKGNKKDSQTQSKGGKGKQDDKSANKEVEPDDVKPIEKAESAKPKDGSQSDATSKVEVNPVDSKHETAAKPERNKKGKNKKTQDENKSDVHVEQSGGSEEVRKATDEKQIKSENSPKGETCEQIKQEVKTEIEHAAVHGENKEVEKMQEGKGKKKQKQNQNEKEKTSKGDIHKEKTPEIKQIQEIKISEPIIEPQIVELPVEEVIKCDSPKNKKQKGKQQQPPNKEMGEKSEFVSLSSILRDVPIPKEKQANVEKSEISLSIKTSRKSRSKTPEIKIEEEVKQQENPVHANILDVKNEQKRKSKTPEPRETIIPKEKEMTTQKLPIDNKPSKSEPVIEFTAIIEQEEQKSDVTEKEPKAFEVKTKTQKEPQIKDEPKKEEMHTHLTPKKQGKRRSKTPEVSAKSDIVPISEKEKSSKDGNIEAPKETAIKDEIKTKNVQTHLETKEQSKRRSKTPEIIPKPVDLPITIKEKEEIPKESSKKSEMKNDEIQSLLTTKSQDKRRSKTPEIKIKEEFSQSAQQGEGKVEIVQKDAAMLPIALDTNKELAESFPKESKEIHLAPGKHSKRRSKTPEIKKKDSSTECKKEFTDKVETIILAEKKEEVCKMPERIQEEIKTDISMKDPSILEEKIETSKETIVTEKAQEEFKTYLAPKKQNKRRSKTPEVQHKTEMDVKQLGKEEKIPPIPQDKCLKDIISESLMQPPKHPSCSSPEIKVIPEVKEDIVETPKDEKHHEVIPALEQPPKPDSVVSLKPSSKKQRKSRSKTPEVKVENKNIPSAASPMDDILPSIATSIEESLKKLVSDADNAVGGQCEKPHSEIDIGEHSLLRAAQNFALCPINIVGLGIDIGKAMEISKGIESEKESKGQEKHKKNKKSGKKESKSISEEAQADEEKDLFGDIVKDFAELGSMSSGAKTIDTKPSIQMPEEFVIHNPISDDIISALLLDDPPKFIDETMKDEFIPTTDSTQQPLGTINPNEQNTEGIKVIEHRAEFTHDKFNKGKGKKHEKKKHEKEEMSSPVAENAPLEIAEEKTLQESSKEIHQMEPPKEVQQMEAPKTPEPHPMAEPKPNKRNKDKKQKGNQKETEMKDDSVQQTSEAVIVPNKPIEVETIHAAPMAEKSDVKDCVKCVEKCMTECEGKSCESCPKKKKQNKGKGKGDDLSLAQELAEACKLEKPEEKVENALKNIIVTPPVDISKVEPKDVNPAPSENFEFLKSPEDSKQTDVQETSKSKRGSKSPAKQSKNLCGPSSSPAKSSKCDYKKEKNKGDKKGTPDTSGELSLFETITPDTKCVQEGTSQCKIKTEQKTKTKRDKSDTGAVSIENIEDFEEEFVYKYSFRTVFIANACHVCKIQLKEDRVVCRFCHLVCYCTEGHRDDDWASHQSLCYAICTLSHVKAQEHIYGDAKCLNGHDYRLLRMQGIVSCEKILKRKLCPWEQEVLLYPRMCLEQTCREWRSSCLKDCEGCGQVSYCTANPSHLPADHSSWCPSYRLYHRLVAHQLHQGRIEPILPSKIFQEQFHLPDDTTTLFDTLYGEHQQMDECYHATLTQLSTAPLTALYAYQKGAPCTGTQDGQPSTSKIPMKPSICIHIIGAELQFEADTLNKWESFFLHLTPEIQDLRIVFIGPELNTSNLPVDLLSKIRMCPSCKQTNRAVRFEFHDTMLYHDFVESSKFSKPDLICAFNPGFHRATGYAGLDTWPETIASALRLRVPLCITAYTQYEMPRDLARVSSVCPDVKITAGPIKNPYASLRPDRNFISDDEMPLIFKNYQLAVVSL